MTTLRSHIVTGEIVPGKLDPRLRRSYFTNRPWGEPIKQEHAAVMPTVAAQQLKPKPLGDEGNMMNILQKVMQQQGGDAQSMQAPTKQSMPGDRTWRNK